MSASTCSSQRSAVLAARFAAMLAVPARRCRRMSAQRAAASSPTAAVSSARNSGTTRRARTSRAVAPALTVVILGMAGCGSSQSLHPGLQREQVRPCVELASASRGLAPVLVGLHNGRINLATTEPVRHRLLRFTGDVARWAAASGTMAFTTLFRHLRQLWHWPPALIPELADRIRHDIAAATAYCATAHSSQ